MSKKEKVRNKVELRLRHVTLTKVFCLVEAKSAGRSFG